MRRLKHRRRSRLKRGFALVFLGTCLVSLVPQAAEAQAEATPANVVANAPPLRATPSSDASGDGRTPIRVVAGGGPAAHPDELKGYPLLPSMSCEKATVIAASDTSGPALIPSASSKAQTIRCQLHFRGVSAPFEVAVPTPPPGLYAEVSNLQPMAGDGEIRLRPFSINRNAKPKHPKSIRAAASAGELVPLPRGELSYRLPDSDAPRALSLVFTDGKSGGAVFLPLTGKTILPIKTRPKTMVQVRIAGSWFGPLEAKERRTMLPIEVPPGVRNSVVQAIGTRGNITETFADLQTPELPRLAAIAAKAKVAVGESVEVYVALASPQGTAAPKETRIEVKSERGTVTTPTWMSPGLWRFSYKAEQLAGTTELQIFVPDSKEAGTIALPMDVIAAAPRKFVFEVEDRAYQPGEEIRGTIAAIDAFGNEVQASALTLTLDGKSVALSSSDTGTAFVVRVPKQLAASRKMTLRAKVGTASEDYGLATIAGPSVKADIAARVDERKADLLVTTRDRYGNAAGVEGLSLQVDAGSASALVISDQEARAVVQASPATRSTRLRVFRDGKELGSTLVTFDPPGSAILVGLFAHGAWTSNGGDLQVARASLGLGVRRRFGPIETSILLGLEGFSSDDRVRVDVAGVEESLDRRLRGVAIPMLLRGRKRITREIGIAAALGVVPTATSARLAMDASGSTFRAWTTGARVQLSGDYRLASGRIVLGTSLGRAKLSEGPIVGDIDGFRIYAGYEVWPLVFGQ